MRVPCVFLSCVRGAYTKEGDDDSVLARCSIGSWTIYITPILYLTGKKRGTITGKRNKKKRNVDPWKSRRNRTPVVRFNRRRREGKRGVSGKGSHPSAVSAALAAENRPSRASRRRRLGTSVVNHRWTSLKSLFNSLARPARRAGRVGPSRGIGRLFVPRCFPPTRRVRTCFAPRV